MRILFVVFVTVLATAVPTSALLGAKLALLGALKGGIGGIGGLGGGIGNGIGGGVGSGLGGGLGGGVTTGTGVVSGYTGGYGSGGYNGGYNQGYYYGPQNRPVYSASYPTYSAGGQYGGYSSGDQVVRVIKVVVPQQEQRYATNYETVASPSWSSYAAPAPIPIPAPVAIPAPVHATSYVSAPSVTPVHSVVSVAPVQRLPAPIPQPLPVQSVIQNESADVPSVVFQPPQTAQTVTQTYAQAVPQSTVRTYKVLVDEGTVNQGAALSPVYGPPPAVSVGSAASSWGGNYNNAGWNSGSGLWSQGLKRGGIWEKLGC